MARRKKKVYPLSEKGINQLRGDLELYKYGLLDKAEQLVRELSDKGIETIDRRIAAAKGEYVDKEHTTITDIRLEGNKVVMEITVQGSDIIFIEFGAGIHYNGGKSVLGTSNHPKGVDMGYTIGGYPKGREGYSLGRLDSWHYGGEVVHGTEATMPMLGAVVTAKKAAISACKKVFKS